MGQLSEPWHEYVDAAERLAALSAEADAELEHRRRDHEELLDSARKAFEEKTAQAKDAERDIERRFTRRVRHALHRIHAVPLLLGPIDTPPTSSPPPDVATAAAAAESAIAAVEHAVEAELMARRAARRRKRRAVAGGVVAASIVLVVVLRTWL